MNITFEGKELSGFGDNLTLSWYVKSEVNEYRVSVDFIGAVQEDDTIDPVLSMGADISINEIKHNDHALINKIATKITESHFIASSEIEIMQETIMVNAPDIRESIIYHDESSYDSTIDYLKDFFSALTTTLINEELDKNIDTELYV